MYPYTTYTYTVHNILIQKEHVSSDIQANRDIGARMILFSVPAVCTHIKYYKIHVDHSPAHKTEYKKKVKKNKALLDVKCQILYKL